MKIRLLCILVMCNLFCAHAQLNIQNGLQACYPLDCSSIPANGASTGSALNGTLNGNVVCVTGHLGQTGTAVDFGGTAADYIALPASILIKPTTSLTVSGWYYVTSTTHQDLIFTKNQCASNFNGYNLVSDLNKFYIYKLPGMTASCASGISAISGTFQINTWHHVVFYLDNSKAKIIVDNSTPVVVTHNIQFDYNPAGKVILGGTNEGASNFPYSGYMDDVRFYNRELSAGQIDTLFQQSPSCTLSVAAPTASFVSEKTTICAGETVLLTNISMNATSYQWQTSGGIPATSTQTNPVIKYPNVGNYSVTLIASNAGGTSTYTANLSVVPCTSLQEEGKSPMTIFPNPGTGKFTVRGGVGKVTISTVTGIEILKSDLSVSDILDLSDENPGVYLVTVLDGNGKVVDHRRILLAR
jgi:PKD repeat protein